MPAPKGNKHALGNPGGGRPSLYKREYANAARELCLLGATDEELAKAFDVNESTINDWKQKHIEFTQALKEGKEIADSRVASRLYERALGYEHDSEEIKVVNGEVVRIPVKKVYPPDPTSSIFWLKNRQKDKWRDKQEVEHSGHIDRNSSDEELDAIIERASSETSKDN